MIEKYRSKTFGMSVDAVQFDGTDEKIEAVIRLTGIKDMQRYGNTLRLYPSNRKRLHVNPGDYIFRDPANGISVMNKSLFEDRFSIKAKNMEMETA